MARMARFRVVGILDGPRPQAGTVTVDRTAGLFSVRAYRRRKTYTVPLAAVADMVVAKLCRAEAAAKAAARKVRGRR